jgi:hypothetical protein
LILETILRGCCGSGGEPGDLAEVRGGAVVMVMAVKKSDVYLVDRGWRVLRYKGGARGRWDDASRYTGAWDGERDNRLPSKDGAG